MHQLSWSECLGIQIFSPPLPSQYIGREYIGSGSILWSAICSVSRVGLCYSGCFFFFWSVPWTNDQWSRIGLICYVINIRVFIIGIHSPRHLPLVVTFLYVLAFPARLPQDFFLMISSVLCWWAHGNFRKPLTVPFILWILRVALGIIYLVISPNQTWTKLLEVSPDYTPQVPTMLPAPPQWYWALFSLSWAFLLCPSLCPPSAFPKRRI